MIADFEAGIVIPTKTRWPLSASLWKLAGAIARRQRLPAS